MGNKHSTTSQKAAPIPENQDLSDSDCKEAGAHEDPLILLRAENEGLQEQLRSIRAEALQNKEREQAFVKQWENCVETMKVQVKTSGEELASARQKVTEQADELTIGRQEARKLREEHSAALGEFSKLRDEHAATLVEARKLREEHSAALGEFSKLREEHAATLVEAAKHRDEHSASIDVKTKELAAARTEIQQKMEACNTLAARAAQLEVEVVAAQEDASAAIARSKAATEREANAVRQKILAESAQKTAEMAQSAAEARASAASRDSGSTKDAAVDRVTAQAAVLQQDLNVKAQELAVALKAKTEVSDELAAVQLRLEAKVQDATTQMATFQKELTVKEQDLAEAVQAKVEASDEVTTLILKLDAKVKELATSQSAEADSKMRLQELQAKRQGEADDAATPPLKKVKLEPGVEPAPPAETQSQLGMGMQDEQVQLLLGEMEMMQEEKKKRDKVLKEFKQLKKMTVEQYVESLSTEAEANKATTKAKGKTSTPVADVKKRQVLAPASENVKRQR